jgi:MscS family membrane protein
MRVFLVLLLFLFSLYGNENKIDVNSSVDSNKVEKVIHEVSDTFNIVSDFEEVDSVFLYVLFKLNEGFKSIGFYFNFLNLDTAKTLLIFIILASSWFFRYLISYSIERKFARTNVRDDLIYKLVESVKVPFLWFLLVISVFWSVKVFYFPGVLDNNIVSLYKTIQLFTGVWLVWNILSNYKEIYLEKKKDLKVEEVDLILISLKIVLILVSVLITIYTYWPDVLKYIGGAGLVIGIFMKDSFSSYLAAFKLVTEKDISVGDWIKYSKGEGTIMKIGLFYTKIRAFDQSMILVSNSDLISDTVINYDKRVVRRIDFDFYLPINLHSTKISSILKDIRKMMENHDGISSDTKLAEDKKMNSVRKREYGFSDTLFVHLVDVQHGNKVNVYAFTKKDDWEFQRATKEDVILKIKEILESYGCSMIIEAKYLQNPYEQSEESFIKNDKK